MMELIERIEGAGPPIALLVIIVAIAIYRALQITKAERTHRRKMLAMAAEAEAAALRAIGDTHDD